MSTTEDLTCRELVEVVTAYLDDAMPEDERARFESHLGACAKCRAYLAQFRQTIRLAGHLREDDLPAGARERMLAAFRDWRRTA